MIKRGGAAVNEDFFGWVLFNDCFGIENVIKSGGLVQKIVLKKGG